MEKNLEDESYEEMYRKYNFSRDDEGCKWNLSLFIISNFKMILE